MDTLKGPNALMNDYTKNISQSIFTPGVYKVDQKIEKSLSKFAQTRGRNPISNVSTKNYKTLFTRDVKGMKGTVRGPLGEKKVKVTRPSTASVANRKTWRMSTFDESTEKMKVYYPDF